MNRPIWNLHAWDTYDDYVKALETYCDGLEKALDRACARIEWLDAYVGDIIGFEPRDKETWLNWFLEVSQR